MNAPRHILPIIVFSQFCCTSLWFAGNGVMDDLVTNFHLHTSALGHLTSAVQFGFISGTLLIAVFTIADRFAPSKVFLISALAGASFNMAIIWEGNTITTLLILRFLTGFFLAGIYPIGMKIAADYFKKGLGKSLGFLVGALVVGTAFPHLLKGFNASLPWHHVLIATSCLAGAGGLLIFVWVPNGPYRKPSQKFNLSAFFKVFKNHDFRSAAFGYFGHMWELYAFWAFVPVMLIHYKTLYPEADLNVPVLSFIIIGIGGVACIFGAYISMNAGTKKTAFIALLLSCTCCIFSPLIFFFDSAIFLVGFLVFWGMVVITDSPLFSTLVANNAVAEARGTALTIVNCIGFAITIFSIQLMNYLRDNVNPVYLYLVLALGPILGLIALSERSGRKTHKLKV